jgi:hypothetical protein
MEWQHLIIETLGPARFFTPEMAFAYFGAHNFTATSYMEAALSSLMSPKLWHFKKLLRRSPSPSLAECSFPHCIQRKLFM